MGIVEAPNEDCDTVAEICDKCPGEEDTYAHYQRLND